MRVGIAIIFSLIFFYLLPAQDEDCTERYTTAGNLGMTITNNGLIGNAFRGNFNLNGWPSCEFPIGSGVEHIFEGGLWVGAKVGGEPEVSTGAADAASGYTPGASGFEFYSPEGTCIDEHSSLFDSPFYSPFAISHQDFITNFADTALIVPGTSIPIGSSSSGDDHDPLGIDVTLQAYNWNFAFANFFVILNFRVKNIGTNMLDEVYIGEWADGVIRNVNITQPGGSAFFNKGGNGFIDSLHMGYEFDAAGDLGFTESYVAIKFLGAEDQNRQFFHPEVTVDTNFKCHYNTWQFRNVASPMYFFPTSDQGRYDKLSAGLNHYKDPSGVKSWNPDIKNEIKTANNRSNLVSVGPFPSLAPGQYIDIAFAIVTAKKKEDGQPNSADTDLHKENLIKNATWAQTAYNGEDVNFNGILDGDEDRDQDGVIDRYILPAPPDVPVSKIVAEDNKIEVYWTDASEASVDPISKKQDFEGYRIYKTSLGFDIQNVQDIANNLKLVKEFDSPYNGLFYDTGFDGIRLATPVKFEGDTNTYRYRYTFENVQNGWQHAIAITAFDQGDAVNNLQSLESAPLAGLKRVFPGTPGNTGFENGDPFVYPNPYYAGASWEGSSNFEEDRKIIFSNLPPKCEVRIYTVAGDFVDSFEHDEGYSGDDIRWFDTYSDTEETTFSGGEHSWDLLSTDNQIIARGIYLFSVKDLDSGKVKQGKFVVIK